jgi:hypothetical protein
MADMNLVPEQNAYELRILNYILSLSQLRPNKVSPQNFLMHTPIYHVIFIIF